MPVKKIEIFTDTEFEHCMPIAAYADEIAAIVDGDEVIRELGGRFALDIEYDYPLSRSVVLSIDHLEGKTEWTRRDLFLAIQKGYEEIYANDEKYGIWGHDIGDLVIEVVKVMPSGKIKLGIGS